MDPRKYLVIIEHVEGTNFSAYVPDLPGCVSTGDTREDILRRIHEAIVLHIEGLREDGLEVPVPTTQGEYVDAWV